LFISNSYKSHTFACLQHVLARANR
jgi:hypothetical protein